MTALFKPKKPKGLPAPVASVQQADPVRAARKPQADDDRRSVAAAGSPERVLGDYSPRLPLG
jgi:hypothetical protein